MPATPEVLDEETTVKNTTPEPVDVADSLPDPDLNDENSDAYADAMGDTPPAEPAPEPEPEVSAEDVATADAETLWRREGSRFVKYEAPKVEPPKIEPWKANIYGKEVEALPGVLKNATGDLFIPNAQVGRLQQMLAHATKYPEVQEMRQQRAKDRQLYEERDKLTGETFQNVLQNTILNPEWMAWAAANEQNYATAKMQVQLQLKEGAVELDRRYGMPQTTTEQPTDGLDPYEADQALDAFLAELVADPAFTGKLTAEDAKAVKAHLRTTNVPIFQFDARHPEQGWALDERPIRALMASRAEVRAAPAAVPPKTPPESVERRNKAAVPEPKATAPKTPPKPTGKTKGEEEPWNNPDLSFAERREAWHTAKGFR